VTAGQDAIDDVLPALAATFNVQYRTATPLDAAASKTYSRPLGQVISRLLDGYNYVIKKDQETIEIVVFSRRGEVTIPFPATKAPPTDPTRSLSRRECGGFLVALAPGHHCPSHSGHLVGKRDGRNLGGPPR
jgi:hypothetical protein